MEIIRLMLVGDYGSGKTSLKNRFVEDIFLEEPIPVFSDEEVWYTKNINENVEVRILDKFESRFDNNFHTREYRHRDGFIVVFDVTNQETFENAKKKCKEAKRYVGDDAPTILIGNKIDIEYRRVVEYQTAKEFADEENIVYFETSTKHDIGVEEAFYGLLRQISNNPVFSNEPPQIPPIITPDEKSKCICF